jgi:NADH-ubiquinone oxidoreductase chain 5
MYLSIVALPLMGAITAGLFGRFIGPKGAGFITTGCVALAAMFSITTVYEVGLSGSPVYVTLAPWIHSEWLDASWGFLFDSLTTSMLVIVTGISALVHCYATGYMSHDPHIPRFMSYLSLFTFFMLMLITAENFVQMFLGWEGVGLCSYLLINFWYTRIQANKAAMKAMIVNRVGDFGFALGIFGFFATFHTVEFSTLFAQVPAYVAVHGDGWITVLCLFLFVGAVGKSAQLGLHTWLPDAMEGPTPVSALIHAATMVTAGIFMMIRCSPLFEYAPTALIVVTVFGAMTAFMAATTGMLQNDLKKVIAYSTCSQLGYMAFAVGLSQYSVSMFHLMNHAYFKALLFLSAGSVIHAVADEQDMRRMGGLLRLLPYTYVMMLIGSMALMGFPFLTGFYSKDVILEVAYAHYSVAGTFAHWLGVISAFFTAFYSFRLIYFTFFRDTNAYRTTIEHAHDAPFAMGFPLFVLSLGALFGGYLTRDAIIGPGSNYWGNAIVTLPEHAILLDAEWIPLSIKWIPLVFSLGGATLAVVLYHGFAPLVHSIQMSPQGRELTLFLTKKWLFDRVYNECIVPVALRFGYTTTYKALDKGLIEQFGPFGISNGVEKLVDNVKQLHSGYIYHAAFWMISALFIGLLFVSPGFDIRLLWILMISILFVVQGDKQTENTNA